MHDRVSFRTTRQQRRALAAANRREPDALRMVPQSEWPQPRPGTLVPAEVWRSKEFILQVFAEPNGVLRLSVARTTLGDDGHWLEGITWDELQRLKRECGRGDLDAVEIYPRDADVINVANMRHLWVLPAEIPFKWTNK